MRYAVTFILGLAVGAASVFFLLRRPREVELPVRAPAVAPAAHPAAHRAATSTAAPLSEEAVLSTRVGMQISPVTSENGDEPSQKSIPKLNLPDSLTGDAVVIPVADVRREDLHDMFHERRGTREHRAIDIASPRGTPVLAAIDGTVAKLFLSKPGGITLYEYDPSKAYAYYYAHLDGYAPGIAEGQALHRGDVIGFVGTSGNAPPNAPHLHFSIEKLTTPGRWWQSDAIDPYPILTTRGVTIHRAGP
jgi:murein DD-endopeptidase MepM/ murein hydrolase activator NlpD